MTARRGAVLAPVCLIAAACAHERVVLLPGETGRPVGALAVIGEDGSDRAVLSSAYSAAGLADRGEIMVGGAPVRLPRGPR